jgi:meso-butanediol dehydrogenase/(S,S)-butanediol dehydrogenase/diacetyl reductase
MDRGSPQGKVAIVTGGTRGIGRAIALELARGGYRVVVAGRSSAAGDEVVSLGEGRVTFVRADVALPDDCERLVRAAVERHGHLDVLVNNAGVIRLGTAESTSVEVWDEVLAVNLRGAFLCIRAAIPHLRRAGGGSIVNVSSIDASWAEPQLAAYCASKAGLIGLTRSVALDHGPDGIRCNAVCPGYIETDMLEEWYAAALDPTRARVQVERAHPLVRIGSPEDVAAVVVWLTSDAARFVTGQCFVVDGGLTCGGSLLPAAPSSDGN